MANYTDFVKHSEKSWLASYKYMLMNL
jgi:hypothetical protein